MMDVTRPTLSSACGLLWLYLLGFGFMALSLEPGFLDFDNLPDTNFTCVGKVIGGYYADLETNCQMFHVCTIGQLDEPMDIRFLCLNGTVFDQETRVCERIDEVDCSKSERFYSLNLELYGNSPPTLEENSETEQPLIIKSSTSATATTPEPPRKTTRPQYYTTIATPLATTQGDNNPHVISGHHFPVVNSNSSPDIRFNPEEINISLHPGAPPDIRTNSGSYHQQHGYGDKKVTNSEKINVVTTHRAVYDNHKVFTSNSGDGRVERPQAHGSANTQSVHNYNHPTPSDINYEFAYGHADDVDEYHTDEPDDYQYHRGPSQGYTGPLHNPQVQQFKSSTTRNDYTHTTTNVNYQPKSSTTIRNYFIQTLNPPSANQQHHYGQLRTEKLPQRIQLPLPPFPTLPPLTFSSPAPFSLHHHIETKRYTKDHIPPPRIIVSASASVSDASGRRLNYSLGTIGAAQILEEPPHSYDDYKEEDVGLDPFYHDVPKVKHSSRRKRSAEAVKYSDIIKNDEEAVNVLKFLFDWYKNEKTNPARFTTPISTSLSSDAISRINHELAPEENNEKDDVDIISKTSDLFNKKSKYSIVGKGRVLVDKDEIRKINNIQENIPISQTENVHIHANDENHPDINPRPEDELFKHEEDYVNDNYEPDTYGEGRNHWNGEDTYQTENTKNESNKNYLVHEFISQSEEAKNLSLPLDYVDDNIEPIYYRDRHTIIGEPGESFENASRFKDESIGVKSRPKLNKTDELVMLLNTTKGIVSQDQPKIETITEEFVLKKQDTDEYLSFKNISNASQPNASEADVKTTEPLDDQISTNAISNKIINENLTTTSENKSNNDNFITTTKRTTIKNNRRRGRRKHYSNIETTTKSREVELKNVLKEKLIEKPYRAKDDYDYLRTVLNVLTPTVKVADDNGDVAEGHNNEIPSNSSQLSSLEVTVHPTALVESKFDNGALEKVNDSSDIVITTTTTTEKTRIRNNKRRRGRQRHNSEASHNNIIRRRKLVGEIESHLNFTGTETDLNESAERKADIFGNKTMIQQKKLSYGNEIASHITEDFKASVPSEDPNISQHSLLNYVEPFSEVVETTTGHNNITRGKTRFIKQLPLMKQELLPERTNQHLLDTTEANPKSTVEHLEVLGTPSAPSTESLLQIENTSTTSESFSRATVNVESSTANYVKEMHETSFVPTTETQIFAVKEKLQKDTIMTAGTSVEYISNLSSTEHFSAINQFTPQARIDDSSQFLLPSDVDYIKEIYATSFVPTTETYHVTKKKQLKDIVDPEILSVLTPRSLELITTDSGSVNEESSPVTTFTSENVHELTQEVESTTEYFEVLTEIPKQMETENISVIIMDNTTEKQIEVLESEGPHETKSAEWTTELKQVVTEEVKHDKLVEITTATTEQSEHTNEYNHPTETTTEKNRKEDDIDISSYHDDLTKVLSTKIVETTTEDIPQTTDDNPKTTTEEIKESVEDNKLSSYEEDLIEIMSTKTLETTTEVVTLTNDNNSETTTEKFNGELDNKRSSPHEDLTEVISTQTVHTTTEAVTLTSADKIMPKETISLTNTDQIILEVEASSENSSPASLEKSTNVVYSQKKETVTEKTEVTRVQTPSTTRRTPRRYGTPTRRRNYSYQRPTHRHRFSTQQFTRRPDQKQTIEDEIIDELTRHAKERTTESVVKSKEIITEFSTNVPLRKSASPTLAEEARDSLPTTPLSRKSNVRKHFFFNCFGKEVDRFYPDARDCRLFHYCSQGYGRNQLIDFKFVCDLNTYFDDEKTICTKEKPKRCL